GADCHIECLHASAWIQRRAGIQLPCDLYAFHAVRRGQVLGAGDLHWLGRLTLSLEDRLPDIGKGLRHIHVERVEDRVLRELHHGTLLDLLVNSTWSGRIPREKELVKDNVFAVWAGQEDESLMAAGKHRPPVRNAHAGCLVLCRDRVQRGRHGGLDAGRCSRRSARGPGAEKLLHHGICGLGKTIGRVGNQAGFKIVVSRLHGDHQPGQLPIGLRMVRHRKEYRDRVAPLYAKHLAHSGLLAASQVDLLQDSGHRGRQAVGSCYCAIFDDFALCGGQCPKRRGLDGAPHGSGYDGGRCAALARCERQHKQQEKKDERFRDTHDDRLLPFRKPDRRSPEATLCLQAFNREQGGSSPLKGPSPNLFAIAAGSRSCAGFGLPDGTYRTTLSLTHAFRSFPRPPGCPSASTFFSTRYFDPVVRQFSSTVVPAFSIPIPYSMFSALPFLHAHSPPHLPQILCVLPPRHSSPKRRRAKLARSAGCSDPPSRPR